MAIVVLVCRENDTAKKKNAPRQSCIQKLTFSAILGAKTTGLFAMYTM
jgi:hypothetical protein